MLDRTDRCTHVERLLTGRGAVNNSLVIPRRTGRRDTALDGSEESSGCRALTAEVRPLTAYRRCAMEDTVPGAAGDRGKGNAHTVLRGDEYAACKSKRG